MAKYLQPKNSYWFNPFAYQGVIVRFMWAILIYFKYKSIQHVSTELGPNQKFICIQFTLVSTSCFFLNYFYQSLLFLFQAHVRTFIRLNCYCNLIEVSSGMLCFGRRRWKMNANRYGEQTSELKIRKKYNFPFLRVFNVEIINSATVFSFCSFFFNTTITSRKLVPLE